MKNHQEAKAALDEANTSFGPASITRNVIFKRPSKTTARERELAREFYNDPRINNISSGGYQVLRVKGAE